MMMMIVIILDNDSFSHAVTCSDCVASNDRMSNESGCGKERLWSI
jgi:hypothetical protein